MKRKLIWYDLKNGMKSNRIKIIFFIVALIIINLTGINSINNCEKLNNVNGTIMDYICYVMGGPQYIPPNMFELYRIPILWLLPNAIISYVVGYFATTDLENYGMQVLIRSESRIAWWSGKCVWNFITVIVMYIILYSVTFISALVTGARMSYKLTPDIVKEVCNIDNLNGKDSQYLICLILMPVIMTLALSILQMVIELLTSPIIGFIITQSILLLSTIFSNPILFPNFAMLSHNKITCGSGIKIMDGLIICSAVYIVSFIIGVSCFARMDILEKKER